MAALTLDRRSVHDAFVTARRLFSEAAREAIAVGLGSMGLISPDKSKIVRIKNTNRLEMVDVSDAFAAELANRPDLEIIGQPREMEFDAEDNLRSI